MEEKKTLRQRIRERLYRNLPYLIILSITLIFLFILFFPRIVITIHAGRAGVLYKRLTVGTVTDYVYPEGLYLIAPWNRMYIYNVRKQVVTKDYSFMTAKGLPVTLTISIRYQPDYDFLGYLHKSLGPDYLDVVVWPSVEATIRQVISKLNVEEVYSTQESVLSKLVNEALDDAASGFVMIDDVLIRKVSLPANIQTAVEKKLTNEQEFQAYEFILKKEAQEAERKRIEARGIRDFQATVKETLNADVLKLRGVMATEQLATSQNAKTIVIGGGKDGLPVILNGKE
ncbi:MAG: prohibitin family protein [Nitrospinae bacterium]|nr:prohibitin family protein [Nitrospinota bacterium]